MKQQGTSRKPYNGNKKALAIALDVGTTFSGVSYAVLDPGEVPKIYEVTRFPGQEHQAGNPKIPTTIWYDRHGDPVKAGAEADEQSIVTTAEEQGWTKVELFKLRLRPKSMKLEMNGMKLPHLPKSKSAIEVFGDFLKYLFRCTRSFIIESHAAGAVTWKAVENDIQFVLSHPNGWEGAQQSKMRKAAIYAGLVPNTDEGKARVRFVTEGEASLHACILNGLTDDVLSNPSQHGFVVADAGGGTLDISSYAIKGVFPLLIEEIAPPDCLFSGSVFVSRRARKFLEHRLSGSPQYSTPAMLDHIAKRFDETTKRLFRKRAEIQYLPFGSPLDRDDNVGIRGGKLRLTGDEVAELFEPSIEAAVSSIRNQVVLSGGMVKSVWLVGGFASSPWLFSQLQERLTPDGIVVSRPDGPTSKAVANGAIAFYCDHHVGARIAKYMYGVEFLREFDANDPEHKERQNRLFQLPSGPKLLPDAFDCILARHSRVKESTTFSRKYCTELTSLSTLAVFEIEIWCYRGPGEQPKWILRGQDDFSTLCFVRADLSPLTASAKAMTGQGGKKYWTIVFSIEIHFGLTEFKARIKWNDDGKVRYGPASIVYDEGGNKELEDDKDSQDENSVLPPSRYVSRAPSMAPSRTHSISTTPQTTLSPVDDHTVIGSQTSRSHSTSHTYGDRHPDGYTESSVSKKSKSSSSHSNPKPSSQHHSPSPSTVSHHTSRSERSQHSPHSSQLPSRHSASPREPPRDTSHHSPSPRELSHPPLSQPVSREPSQLGQQSGIATPTSIVQRDREIPRSGRQTPNYYASTPTQSHVSHSQQPAPPQSILNDTLSSISRAHQRSRSIVTATEPVEQTGVKFPSVSITGSPHETPAPRSAVDSRKTSLTPSDSASNVHVNHTYGNGTVPGTVLGSVADFTIPESTVGKKSKKDKNKSTLSTISSASHSTTKPPTEQPKPPEPAPPVPQISIPASPSVSSSMGGSGRLTTNPNTPITTRSLKSSLASSLSYATNRPEQPPPPQPPAMSRQNSDTGSGIAGGLGNALGGVLHGVWGAYKSASVSPVVENPPPGPATAAFESTLETIEDIEIPGGFGGEQDREAPVPPQDDIPEPVIIPPSPPKPEEPEPPKAPTPKVEVAELPPPQRTPPEPELETAPQTPIEPGQSTISSADRKKTKKQREKERKEKEAQEKKEREEREAQERKERDERKRQEKAERDARKKEREELEEQERRAQAERAEKERIEREAHEQAEREARERAEREAREQAEIEERAEREAREAQEQAERVAKEQAEKAAKDKVGRAPFKARAEREAAKKAEQEAKLREREEAAAQVKAQKDAKRRADKEAKERAEREKEKAEQEAREKTERETKKKREREKERIEREEKERIEREEKERVEREEKERLEREEKERFEREEKERLEREENERIERERIEKAEREAREKAEHEAKEREEEERKKVAASRTPSAWGSVAGRDSRSRKASALSQKDQKNEWATWDSGSNEKKDGLFDLPPLNTSSISGGVFSSANDVANIFGAGQGDLSGGGEEVELRTPLTKKGKRGVGSSRGSKVGTPPELAELDRLGTLEDANMNNMSARVSVSSENERFTDAEQGLSPTEPTPPALAPEILPEVFPSNASELLNTPKNVKEEVPQTSKPWPAPPSVSTLQARTPAPAPDPSKAEPEKPLSLWERKKLKVPTANSPGSSLFNGGDTANSSGVWGDAGGGNVESIAMPSLVGDRQSIFTDTARGQERENQRENVVEGLLGSGRRRNDSAQSQMTTKPVAKSTPAPAPQKAGGWGSWGSSFVSSVANVLAVETSPSPEPPPVMPKIEDPPRGFTPNQPPKSQPAGFGSLTKPAWSTGGAGNSNAWGSNKSGPASTTQKPPVAPAWGNKPAGSAFGSGGTGWGGGTGPTFGGGTGKHLTVDTTTKPAESSPNTAGPENIPESAIEIKHVPAPGGFHSSITDKEGTGDGEPQDAGWGWVEADAEGPKEPSPTQEQPPETPAEEIGGPEKAEETATPAEEEEFDWLPSAGKKKKGQINSVAQTPSVPNTPDPENADEGTGGGGNGGGKKKKRKGKK